MLAARAVFLAILTVSTFAAAERRQVFIAANEVRYSKLRNAARRTFSVAVRNNTQDTAGLKSAVCSACIGAGVVGL